MAIKINSGVNGALSLANVFDSDKPVTLCFFAKVNSFPNSSTSNVFPIRTTGGVGYYGARIFYNSSTDRLFSATSNNGSTNQSASHNFGANLAGQWRCCVAVFASNTLRTVYTRINSDAGGLLTASNASSSVTSAQTGLELLSGVWANSDSRYAYLTIYEGGLTAQQADEFSLSAAVQGLTPRNQWAGTSDWGDGTIADTGSNPIALDPPATWIYDADNPNFATGPNAAPVITGSKLHEFQYQINATDADGQALTYSVSTQGNYGAAVVNAAGLVTYTPGGSFAGQDLFVVAVSDGIGTAYSTIAVTAAGAEDTTPNAFTFGSVADAAVGETIYSVQPVTLAGMTPGVNALAVPGNGMEYRISSNGGATFGDWLAVNSNVQNGWVIEARIESSPLHSTAVNGQLTIGGVVGTFVVTTEAAVIVNPDPDPFSFGAVVDVELSTITQSVGNVTLTGMAPAVDYVAEPFGGLSFQISTDGGATFGEWLAVPAVVRNGYVLRARITSSGMNSKPVIGSLTIAGVVATFVVTTKSSDSGEGEGDRGFLGRYMVANFM